MSDTRMTRRIFDIAHLDRIKLFRSAKYRPVIDIQPHSSRLRYAHFIRHEKTTLQHTRLQERREGKRRNRLEEDDIAHVRGFEEDVPSSKSHAFHYDQKRRNVRRYKAERNGLSFFVTRCSRRHDTLHCHIYRLRISSTYVVQYHAIPLRLFR
jgi:hypothetical protein